jgi:GNAT superfamily N-acetyltransferase
LEGVVNQGFLHDSTVTQADAIEAEAFIDLQRVSPQRLVDEQQFGCIRLRGGCAISLPNAPAIGLNRILGLTEVDDLDKAYAWMSGRAGNRFLQSNASAASNDVREWIRSKGLVEHGRGWAKLTLTASTTHLLTAQQIRTRRARIEEAETFGLLMCQSFGFPETLIPLWASIVAKERWSCFLALDADKQIGTAAMYASGTHAWLGGGTTVPAFRNRGVQKALIRARIEDGIARGVSTFVVETEVPSSEKLNISYNNLRKMGFEHLYDRSNFLL